MAIGRDLLRRLPVLAVLVGCATLRPGAPSEIRLGAQAARHGLWHEARLRFERATRLAPDDGVAWNDLAIAYEGLGRRDDAMHAYERALVLAPGNSAIRGNLERLRAGSSGEAER